jgi:hypothetical protein
MREFAIVELKGLYFSFSHIYTNRLKVSLGRPAHIPQKRDLNIRISLHINAFELTTAILGNRRRLVY